MYLQFVCFLVISVCLSHQQRSVNSRVELPNAHHIVGGIRTIDNEFPYMVALGFGSMSSPVFLCGGTLISDQFVLTAAHCTKSKEMGSVKFARLGSRSLSSTSDNFEQIPVSKIINHPQYHLPSSYNDIALLKLERSVTFSRNVEAALLYSGPLQNIGTSYTALGWGKKEFAGESSDDLLKVELKVVGQSACNRGYRKAGDKLPNGVKNDIQICAGGEIGKDTCQGDSGGPLGYKSGSSHYIVGVTSFGKACGLSKIPGIYTRVSAYVTWIESVIKS